MDGADFEDNPFIEWDYNYILKFRDKEHTNQEYITQSREDDDKANEAIGELKEKLDKCVTCMKNYE